MTPQDPARIESALSAAAVHLLLYVIALREALTERDAGHDGGANA